MAKKSDKSVVVTNSEFQRTQLADICSSHNLNTTWVTKRQASKYRNKKGRVYLTIQHGGDKGFGT
jgi:hypothetical protein